jgi:hypothetical protein
MKILEVEDSEFYQNMCYILGGGGERLLPNTAPTMIPTIQKITKRVSSVIVRLFLYHGTLFVFGG